MHSQVTDYQVLGLDRDPQHQLLVSAAQHHQGSLCVTLHSLSGDNFFAYKVSFPFLLLPGVAGWLTIGSFTNGSLASGAL